MAILSFVRSKLFFSIKCRAHQREIRCKFVFSLDGDNGVGLLETSSEITLDFFKIPDTACTLTTTSIKLLKEIIGFNNTLAGILLFERSGP